MSYMIILEPSKTSASKYIQASQKLFSAQNCGYLLKKGGMPHITICQFQCEQKEVATKLWEEIKKSQPNSFSIRFISLSLIQVIEELEDLYWAELSVARENVLLKLYEEVTSSIQSKGFSIVNDYGDYYRPHLTLARIQLPYTIQTWPRSLLGLETFYLNFSRCLI